MEYEELEKLWENYNRKLEKLEKINKKLIKETLLKKPRRKLNWHKFNSLYGLIMLPIILIVAMHPNFTKTNVDWKLITGCLISSLVVIYLGLLNFKSFKILQKIDLSSDSILDSASRIIEFKKLFTTRWKHAFFYYPIMCVGVLLITWNNFIFDTKSISILIGLFIVTYVANILGPRTYRNRIARLEKDIIDLREYIED